MALPQPSITTFLTKLTLWTLFCITTWMKSEHIFAELYLKSWHFNQNEVPPHELSAVTIYYCDILTLGTVQCAMLYSTPVCCYSARECCTVRRSAVQSPCCTVHCVLQHTVLYSALCYTAHYVVQWAVFHGHHCDILSTSCQPSPNTSRSSQVTCDKRPHLFHTRLDIMSQDILERVDVMICVTRRPRTQGGRKIPGRIVQL